MTDRLRVHADYLGRCGRKTLRDELEAVLDEVETLRTNLARSQMLAAFLEVVADNVAEGGLLVAGRPWREMFDKVMTTETADG